jgi:cytosine permease
MQHLTLPDNKQTAWQLAAIQLSGWTSLPILATSVLILKTNSFLGAIFTIIVSNAILWFLRLGILAMSFEKRQSTLDIAHQYLGKAGNYCIAILLLSITLFWFIVQTTLGSNSITHLMTIQENPSIDQFTQVSVFLGLVSTLFCMGGMALLRKLCMICFPILILALFVILILVPHGGGVNHNTTSLSGLTLALGVNLGLTADLPTFFRHSRSWKESVKGLLIVQLASLGLGICSLFLGSIIVDGFGANHDVILTLGDTLLKYFIIGFIFLSLICANVANVYSASVGWELVAPSALVGKKEYFILGLGLTTIFILVSDLFSLELGLHLAENSLINLCIVLLIAWMIHRRKKRASDFFEQTTYFSAWLLSSIMTALQTASILLAKSSTLLIGFITIAIVVSLGLFLKRFLRKPFN